MFAKVFHCKTKHGKGTVMSNNRSNTQKPGRSAQCNRTPNSARLSVVSAEESAVLSSLSAEEFNALIEERSDITRGS